GLAVALAEMAFAGGLGIRVDLDAVPRTGELRTDAVLFSESASRLLVEVRPSNAPRFEAIMEGTACARIGRCDGTGKVVVVAGGSEIISLGIDRLREAWQAPLREL
ncbi:MAG: phosphoribosylformylglycinamidine synthase, partial [bacterium]